MASATGQFPAEQICRDLEARYPSLTLSEDDGSFVVTGTYDLRQDETSIARYRLRIELPADYPATMPRFYETGNRIPRELDNHVNGDRTLCLGVPEQIWIDLDGHFDLLPLLDRHVRTYLIGATNMLAGKGWPYGEYAHGADGLCEFYGAKIDRIDPLAVLELLLILTADKPKGHWYCPCESGKTLRQCHLETVLELSNRKLPLSMLRKSSAMIADGIINHETTLPEDRERALRLLRRIAGEANKKNS